MCDEFLYESDENSDVEESMLHIDENGNVFVIPYKPFDEKYYEEILENIEGKKLKTELEISKDKFFNFDPHCVEVEKIEDAEFLLIIHKEDINHYETRKVEPNTKEETIKSLEEMFNMKIYYGKYLSKDTDMRKHRKKKNK